VPREVTHRYEDPLDRIWIGCAERIGLVVERDPSAFATTDGRGRAGSPTHGSCTRPTSTSTATTASRR